MEWTHFCHLVAPTDWLNQAFAMVRRFAMETHYRLVIGDIPPKTEDSKFSRIPTVKEGKSVQNDSEDPKPFKAQIVWRNVAVFAILHTAAIYGFCIGFMRAKWETFIFAWCIHHFSGMLGITAGAHRLWSHRSYKAKLPLRIVLMIAQTTALQNDLYEWCRDHRVHHKFSETDADPHDARRGFFFSHVGWLLMKKNPMVISQGKKLDFTDLLADPVVAFQRRFYIPLALLLCFVLPTVIPVLFWNESLLVAYFFPTISRYVFTLNTTWLVNSAAHMFGNKPYDKHINPSENAFVTFCTVGEGWHNYHHTFPQDYRAAEIGWWRLNMTADFIDLCAWMGQVTDRKTIPTALAWSRAKKLGDGTHEKELDWMIEKLSGKEGQREINGNSDFKQVSDDES